MKFIKVPISETQFHLHFFCPGCQARHAINDTWEFNGDYEKPTVSPSVLVTWPEGPERKENRCHSFIRDGKIEFLHDCTHALAGKTVELPEITIDSPV